MAMAIMKPISRRTILGAALALPFGALGQASCGASTPRDMEGPFYKPGAPQRHSLLEAGAKGEMLILTGSVLSAQCKPVANALLDFWHADADGAYDNSGYRYRGVQQTDAGGLYRLETVLPARYPGRPRHIHVKVQAPGRRALTTQLYFPDEPRESRDSSYRSALVLPIERRDGALRAQFSFVVDA